MTSYALLAMALSLLLSPTTPRAEEAKKAGELEEVIVKGEEVTKTSVTKPPLELSVDPFESIRDSLKPDESWLLAEHPLAPMWRRSSPELLSSLRVIQPGLPLGEPRRESESQAGRALIQDEVVIRFQPLEKLSEVLGRRLGDKEAKQYQWALSIVDEQGKVFQRFEGKNSPPEELVSSVRNDRGEWMRVGNAYSAVYSFTGPQGAAHTAFGAPLRFSALVRREATGLLLSLDSAVLFGPDKQASRAVKPGGEDLLRAATDWIKRLYPATPLRIRAYAKDASLAEAQGFSVKQFAAGELMLLEPSVPVEPNAAPFSDQRTDLLLIP